MAVNLLDHEKYKEIFSLVPRLTIDAIIWDKDNGIVLTKRAIDPWIGYWHIPGGTVSKGERLEEAVKRIVKQEINVDVEIENFLGFNEYMNEIHPDWTGHSVCLEFLVKIVGGELKVDHQASAVQRFKTLPEPIIAEQKEFLLKNLPIA